ncbi:MAG: hypothetical protein HY332_03785 [Chloroflexi bacterium]|nr:hypothetical protein [Chloroflexota bacterium]
MDRDDFRNRYRHLQYGGGTMARRRSRPRCEHVLEAETRLANALEYLNTLKWSAIMGGPYDSEEYDRAILAYRRAARAAQVARHVAQTSAAQTPAAA